MPLGHPLLRRAIRRLGKPIGLLVVLHLIGTIGYRIISGASYSYLDTLYMTFITIATIGYAEVVDLKDSVGGRVFTMMLGFAGIANTWVIMSVLTAFIVEGDINTALRRRRMLKTIGKLANHYIVCGMGRVGSNVAHELALTARPYVVVDVDAQRIESFRERDPELIHLHADAAEDETLLNAGIARAAGVFAITGDDAKNLVITLSAKQLNPKIRVVARCHEVSYVEKMRRVGADAIVSPDFTGGINIAASMIRPQVVNFLEDMMRSEEAYRVEEVRVPNRLDGATVDSLDPRGAGHLLIALQVDGKWRYNPRGDQTLRDGDVLLFMVTPHGRDELQARFAA
jgi:voltage-gated potassium channel